MATLLLTHPACLDHDPGSAHPESPDRLRAVLAALDDDAFHHLLRWEAPAAGFEQLSRVHAGRYIEAVAAAQPQPGRSVHLDADTVMSAGSWEAAMRAAGAVCAGVDAVAQGHAANAFCAVRPPGHHAERERAMGFCLFNNVAVGAHQARAAHGFTRIAVVDFDVHHGNGTQEAFFSDPALFYASTHERGIYPGTGRADETGIAANIVNLPFPAGTGSVPWRQAVTNLLLPRLDDFRPDMILISAGFDAHHADPLAHLRLFPQDFAWITEEIASIAKDRCDGRVVSTLEGGYDLAGLAESAAAHVRALMVAGESY